MLGGTFVLVAAVVTRMFFPGISEFWLALVTAITLFLIMHIRKLLVFNAIVKEKACLNNNRTRIFGRPL
jgi:hypothetical protein